MPKSYRIRTEPGVDRNINVEINQDFDYLEILSLKLRQEDVYTRFCADYGVVVGRVIVNGGYGVPNAKVSVFVPLDAIDENDPIISTLYPYKNLNTKNEDGYRYNLLPYEQTYGGHTPTGTFPTEDDILTRAEVLEVYEKYYKYTVKTNESGDFMIIGVPLGVQKVVLDLDVSDMGCFSLRPTDLVKMGLATPQQVDGMFFKSSTDLSTLPQIINSVKDVDVASFWGQDEVCNVGITRVDFDLRDFGLDITPSAVFMGSMFSTDDNLTLKSNCTMRDEIGSMCQNVTGPGRILSVRQTIDVDSDGLPVLEQFNLENGGNVIDENGTWLVEVPMNLDYVVTNEFGEQVISTDPSVGIPTKGRYRFKVEWQNEGGLQNEVQRASYLLPNIKDWEVSWGTNRNYNYAFSLDWNEYGDTGTTWGREMIRQAIDCEDRFYEFNYNKVYTVSSLIDRFKYGNGDLRHLGIKGIQDYSCADTVNRFPVNDGVKDYNSSMFTFDFFMFFVSALFVPLLYTMHILFVIVLPVYVIIYAIRSALSWILPDTFSDPPPLKDFIPNLSLAMLTYPDCESCNCEPTYENVSTDNSNGGSQNSSEGGTQRISFLVASNSTFKFSEWSPNSNPEKDTEARLFLAGNDGRNRPGLRVPTFQGLQSFGITLSQSLNQLNTRNSYLKSGTKNYVRVTVKNDVPSTGVEKVSDTYTDHVMVLLCERGAIDKWKKGSLVTFVNPSSVNDVNVSGLTTPNQFGTECITGTSEYNEVDLIGKTVTYLDINGVENTSKIYVKSNISEQKEYRFKSGVEYCQVIDGFKMSEVVTLVNSSNPSIIKEKVLEFTQIIPTWDGNKITSLANPAQVTPYNLLGDNDNLELMVLVKGVDPNTQRQTIEYDLSPLFGNSNGTNIVKDSYYLNIPIQKSSETDQKKPQKHNVSNNNDVVLFHNSFTFTPDTTQYSSFTSTALNYYSSMGDDLSYKPFTNDSKNTSFFTNGTQTPDDNNTRLTGGEYIAGGSMLAIPPGDVDNGRLYSPKYVNVSVEHNDPQKLVLRTDRLPTSDSEQKQDGSTINTSFALYQNDNFVMYGISDEGEVLFGGPNFLGASDNDGKGSGDFSGDTPGGFSSVLNSFSCEGMVPLKAYKGVGTNFQVDEEANKNLFGSERVTGGCYRFVKFPYLVTLPEDLINFPEWQVRYRFMYAACQNVFNMVFQNNWLNGTLFMPAFDNFGIFDRNNELLFYDYCGSDDGVFGRTLNTTRDDGPIYFNNETNNYYYKSSQYQYATDKFVGKEEPKLYNLLPIIGANKRNLWFPTTMMDLGPRDQFTKEICTNPQFATYYVNTLRSTSNSDESSLITMLIISRLTSSGFLKKLLATRTGFNSLFDGRDNRRILGINVNARRIDGDFAQMLSIQSEFGIVPFKGNNYPDRNIFVGEYDDGFFNKSAIFGVFFNSNKQLRQFLTPGKTPYTTFGYPKAQEVPMYQWVVEEENSIFGNNSNNWGTETSNIYAKKYQDMDFDLTDGYWKFSDDGNLGYIYNENPNGEPNPQRPPNQGKYINVGAPFHFYFGLKRGATAINRYITKYISE